MENVLLTEEQRNLIIERLNSDLNQVVRERNRLYANRRNNRNDEEAFTANAARRDELSGNLRLISTYLPGRE